MPAAPETVGAYLATARARLCPPDPAAKGRGDRKGPSDRPTSARFTKHPVIRETLRGIARTGEPGRRPALTTAEIKRLGRGRVKRPGP